MTGDVVWRWAVHPIDAAFGLGKKLGTVEAVDHRAAELLAANRWPEQALFVSLAGGRRRTARDDAREHQYHFQRRRLR